MNSVCCVWSIVYTMQIIGSLLSNMKHPGSKQKKRQEFYSLHLPWMKLIVADMCHCTQSFSVVEYDLAIQTAAYIESYA